MSNKREEHKAVMTNNSMTTQPISLSVKSKKTISLKPFKLIPNASSVKNMDTALDPKKSNIKNEDDKAKTQLVHNINGKGGSKTNFNVQKMKISLTHIQKLLKEKTSPKNIDNTEMHIEKSSSKKMISMTNQICKDKFLTHKKSVQNRSNIKIKNKETTKELFPLTPAQTLKIYGKELTDFEKCEILDYDKIYYMGNGVAKRNLEPKTGYDDETSDYNTYVGEQLNYRYEIIDILGKGSFGQVLKCLDHKTNQLIAVKIIRSKKKFYHQANIEIKILQYINDNDPDDIANVVRIYDSFMFRKHIVNFCN